jgi:phenylpropionate dioxygenase-like ring-hydroxylating dioxygenase large terminal subunit
MQHPKPQASSPANRPDLRKIGANPNFWYPLAIAKHLKRGKTLGVAFAGEPIVLVHTESNKIYALEDRCAHRQIPLSRGVVVGESLRCCYHGWTYNDQGNCAVPYYLPKDVTLPRRVRTYPVRQAYGLIFVFPGDPALAETVPFPDLAEFHSHNFTAVPFVQRANCHYSFMYENVMDMSHQFLHRRWMGEFRHKPVVVHKTNNDVEVDYTFDPKDSGMEGGFFQQVARQPRTIIKYLFPCILGSHRAGVSHAASRLAVYNDDSRMYQGEFVTISIRYPYQTLRLRRPNLEEPMFKLWLTHVPIDPEQKICQPTGVMMFRKPRVPWLLFLLRPVLVYLFNVVFEEDRVIVEAEQQAHDLQGGDWNREVLPFILDLRELLISRGIPIELPSAG